MKENDEKTLFEGSVSRKRDFWLLAIIIAGIGLIGLITVIITANAKMHDDYDRGFKAIFDGYVIKHEGAIFVFLFFLSITLIVVGIVLLFMYFKMVGTLTVTDRRVDFKVKVKHIRFFKGHDYEIFIPNSTLKAVKASRKNNIIIIEGEYETIRFCYIDGVIEALTKVLP